MTRMLASVSTLAEAEIVLAGGADIIELAPTPAAPAAAFHRLVRAVVTATGGRRLVSATSAAAADPDRMAADVSEIAATGVDHVGVVVPSDGEACINRLVGLAPRVRLIAVFLADTLPDLSLLPLLARGDFAGAIIGTRAGHPLALLERFDLSCLRGFVARCHGAGLMAGLTGSLEAPDIPRLLVLEPDVLGFREGLHGPAGQGGKIDLARVREVRGLIPPEGSAPSVLPPGMPDADDRLLTRRAHPPLAEPDVPVDLVFVEDLVLPVFIGAYARERDTPQKVRFAVTASVIRGWAAEDMRDVFSYDLITDGIRMLVSSGHFVLIEALAERIAMMVLGHARVTKVVVRVQKLETGSGAVGVQIERSRQVGVGSGGYALPER